MYIAGLLGLAVMLALILREGAGSIADLSEVGWTLLWLVPLHVLPLMLDVSSWRVLLAPADPGRRAGLRALFAIAAVREAINRLLPVANVGGEIVGVRLLVLRGLPVAPAAASVVVEVSLTIVAEYIFVAIGVLCLLRVTGAVPLTAHVLLALALSLPVVVLIFLLLRNGAGIERFGRLIERTLGARWGRLGEHTARLDAEIRRLYRARRRLLVSLAWQVAAFCAGTIETWLVLHWLGAPVSFADALALESLAQAIRHMAFLVPAGLGVQEAGLIAFGHLIGVSSEAALALSLAKRMREILFGVPALLAWQWVEGRRLVWQRAKS